MAVPLRARRRKVILLKSVPGGTFHLLAVRRVDDTGGKGAQKIGVRAELIFVNDEILGRELVRKAYLK